VPTGRILAVLATPPITSGQRTRGRVELSRQLLGFEECVIVNIFSKPTIHSGDVSRLGNDRASWLDARPAISMGISEASAVLLAYGHSEPSGPARLHRREQIDWLFDALRPTQLPVFQVGDAPRHPSRWQRWTSREYPGVAFPAALQASINHVDMRS
jgi:hypothetical protein